MKRSIRAPFQERICLLKQSAYLIEALKAIDSEQVVIRFISSVRPFTLVPEGNEQGFIQLITPVRTN